MNGPEQPVAHVAAAGARGRRVPSGRSSRLPPGGAARAWVGKEGREGEQGRKARGESRGGSGGPAGRPARAGPAASRGPRRDVRHPCRPAPRVMKRAGPRGTGRAPRGEALGPCQLGQGAGRALARAAVSVETRSLCSGEVAARRAEADGRRGARSGPARGGRGVVSLAWKERRTLLPGPPRPRHFLRPALLPSEGRCPPSPPPLRLPGCRMRPCASGCAIPRPASRADITPPPFWLGGAGGCSRRGPRACPGPTRCGGERVLSVESRQPRCHHSPEDTSPAR